VRSGRTLTLAAAAGLLLAGPLVAAWMARPDTGAGPCVVIAGPVAMPGIPESSGLAVSRRSRGLLWSHNDSGNAAVLFALDTAGAIRGRVRLPIVTRDWEDVSAGGCPSGDCLYIADIGDNKLTRPRVQIYRVPEPAAGDAETAPPEVFNATYPDGPHNAEAMFVVEATVFIITRDRTGGVYRATMTPSGGHDLTLQRIAQLGLGAVTDAEASRDGTSVVVRTSHEAVLYRTADLIRGTIAPYLRIPIDGLREPQGEGVALDGNMLYLSSEGGPMTPAGRFISLRCASFAAADANTVVVFETDKGNIEIEVDATHAPLTAANFLKYVDGGFYDGGTINRAVRPDNTVRHDVEIQVIQFQIARARQRDEFPPVPLERTSVTGVTHVDGAVSMARGGPDTATGSFSIVIGDQPEMNFGGKRNPDGQGFAAFGRVVSGMDVVKAIQASPTGPRGPYGPESLNPPIAIVKARRRE
jgi:peptidyl-prolyl cis-trans isomerase A (cyclophilin A)